MIQRKGFFLAAIILVLIWAACDGVVDAKRPASRLEYLSFTDHGCQGEESLGKTHSSSPYLSRHRLDGDVLILTIHHSANCCPAFVDSISIHENVVDICIGDTLRGCHCICDYENDFAFQYIGTGSVRVRFGWLGDSFDLDTLIHVR